jgi:multidrug resistance protein, MATE family
MKEIAKFSVMPILGAMMMPFFSILNTGVCGFLGDPDILAAYGLGSLTIAIFATSTLVQLSSLQTLIAHCNGSKEFRLARIYLHRQYVITGVGCLVMIWPLLYIKDILIYIGQDPDVVNLAAVYVHYCIPGVLLNAFSMQNVLYCAMLEGTRVFVYEGIVSNVTHISLLILLVGVFDMGFVGLCIASSCQFISRWVCSAVFMKLTDNKNISEYKTEPFFSKASIQDLGHQVRLATTQCVMGVWNWWGLEIFTLYAGYVSTTALAAQSILRAVSMLAYMVPVGLRMATQMTIGKNVGS